MQDCELNQIKYFIADIQDNLDALRLEVNGIPYARYCLEKLKLIRADVNCLITVFENKLIKNDISAPQK